MSDDTITIIDFSHPIAAIDNLKDLPQVIQDAIARADLITSQGFQRLNGHADDRLVWSAGGWWSRPDDDGDEDDHTPEFTVTSIGWQAEGVHHCWCDRDGFAIAKKAGELVAGDRIRFNNRDLLTNDNNPVALQAEVIRVQPLFFPGSVAILTTAGFLSPVNEDKEFMVVEGDYDPTATQMAYTVPPAETHEGKSLE